MTRSADPKRQADLAQIHQAKRTLALTDDAYRALLERVTGKRSAADIDGPERRRVIDHLVSLGFRSRRRTEPHGAPAQRRKIAALLRAQGLTPEYGEGIAKQMFGKRLRLCAPRQLQAVITALIRRRERHRGAGA